MRKEKNIIEIKEDVQIGDVILEKGDKIEVLESSMLFQVNGHINDLYNLSNMLDQFRLALSNYRFDPDELVLVKQVYNEMSDLVYDIGRKDWLEGVK